MQLESHHNVIMDNIDYYIRNLEWKTKELSSSLIEWKDRITIYKATIQIRLEGNSNFPFNVERASQT